MSRGSSDFSRVSFLEKGRPLLLSLAAAVALSCSHACSSGSAESSGPSESWQRRRAEIVCAKQGQCCAGLDVSACAPAEKLFFEANVDRMERALSSGRASYDGAAAEACLAALDGMDCAAWADVVAGRFPEACASFVQGKVLDGEPCRSNFECGSGHCNLGVSAGDATGVCAPRGEAGSKCTEYAPAACEPGLFCKGDTCLPRGQVGAPCEEDLDCYSLVCASGTCTNACVLRAWGQRFK